MFQYQLSLQQRFTSENVNFQENLKIFRFSKIKGLLNHPLYRSITKLINILYNIQQENIKKK